MPESAPSSSCVRGTVPAAPKSSPGTGHVQVELLSPRGCLITGAMHTQSQGLCPGIFPPLHLAYRMLWIQ